MYVNIKKTVFVMASVQLMPVLHAVTKRAPEMKK